MTKSNDRFAEEIRAGIPDKLPQPKPYDTSINHAPRRKDILTSVLQGTQAVITEEQSL